MATSNLPTPVSPRRTKRPTPIAKSTLQEPFAPAPRGTRTARGRDRREAHRERQFGLLFFLAVGVTTLYLFMRSPWGHLLWQHGNPFS